MMRYSFLLLIVLFFVAVAESANRTCSLCSKSIQGQYYTYRLNNRLLTICKSCEQTKPRCNACKLPIHPKNIVIKKGERLCTTCLKASMFCSLCDKRIQGKYYKVENRDDHYCQSCYMRYPKCSVCGKPGQVYHLDQGKNACNECIAKLPRCGTCGNVIAGTYYQVSGSSEKFCSRCNSERPKCYTCSVPLGAKSWKFSDGRKICHKCHDRAIIDINQIKRIVQEVEKMLERYLAIKINHPYDVHIMDLNKQSSTQALNAKEGRTDQSPLFGSELGLYRRVNGKADIFILYGLPIEMLYETAAHELTHAWQAENGPPNQSKLLMEGFAQWTAAQILKVKGYKQALERLESRSDIPYGVGYQKVKRMHKSLGTRTLLKSMRKTTH